LQYAYPDIEWDIEKFMFRGKKSEQRWLKVKIEELVPGIEIFEDYKHPDLLPGICCFCLLFDSRVTRRKTNFACRT
jgi:hypothetical protein